MKPPAKIKVGPFNFTVKHDPQRLKDVSGDAALFAKELLLVVDLGQAPGYLRDSVLHELVHAVYRETPLYDTSEAGYEAEEKIIQAITPRLLAVLRDNPKLVAYLTEKS